MKYKELILSAAKMVWHNKYLWFFGLFAAFLANSEIYKFSGQPSDWTVAWQKLKDTGLFDADIFSKMFDLAQYDPLGLVWRLLVLLAVLILAIFILWLAVVSQGALINNVAKIALGKRVNFKEGVTGGRANLWPVFFFKVIEKVVVIALAALSFLPALAVLNFSLNYWWRALYFIIVMAIIIIAALVILIIRYSISYEIIKSLRFIEALGAGFKLFKNNWLVSIESGVVIFVANFLLSMIALMLASALTIPFVLLMFVFYKIAFVWGTTITLTAGIAVLFILVVLVGGMIYAFNDAFWTLFFLKLSRENVSSWLGSMFFRRRAASINKSLPR